MNIPNFFKGAAQVLPGIINTVTSVVRDKNPANLNTPESELVPPVGGPSDWMASGVKLSSKRLINISGTGTMMAIAVSEYVANGLSWPVVALFAAGAAFSILMAWVTKKSEE